MFDKCHRDNFFDETFINNEEYLRTRNHYVLLQDIFSSFTGKDFKEKQHSINRAFVEHGVTFNVYSDNQGTEIILPFLCNHIINDVTRHISQSEASTTMKVSEFFVLHT